MSNTIRGKVVVITGASSGLGEATARHLSAEGALIVLGARRADRLQSLANELTATGGKVLVVPTDVTRYDQMQKLVDTAVEEYGRVDVMLNNAGVAPLSMLESGKVHDWDQLIDVNIKGVVYGIGAALSHMKRQKSGHIINVASIAAFKIVPATAIYSATKSAVRVISEGLRLEVKPYNIRTTIISPGTIASELPNGVSEPMIAEAVKKIYASALPAESFAQVVAFAISQPAEVDVNEIVFRPTWQES